MPLECFKLTLEYDGTRYHGWQSQKNSRTIQDALIAAAREVLQVDVDVGGAGRTDAGVHALAQVAHLKFQISSSKSRGSKFRVSSSGSRGYRSRVPSSGSRVADSIISARNRDLESETRNSKLETRDREPETRALFLRYQLNQALPSDIVVLNVEKADANFHARHDAVRRYYLYQVAKRKTAFAKKYVWWVKEPLNLTAMQHAAEMLLGRHDFAAFGEKGGEKKSTLVEVYECSLNGTEELILIRIGASHFLWKMV